MCNTVAVCGIAGFFATVVCNAVDIIWLAIVLTVFKSESGTTFEVFLDSIGLFLVVESVILFV